MRFVADFHIHSKYSRACSQKLITAELDRWAHDKGILVMGTGDFTHPKWREHLRQTLEPAEPGLFRLKKELKLPAKIGTESHTRFLLTAEVSSIYSRAGKVRRVHTLLFCPSFESAEKVVAQLERRGAKLGSDGRPIVGIDARELAAIALDADKDVAVVPAHIWTPWFSLFGSKSGFNSLEECFGDYSDYIFAAETGLSSDPSMNWRLSALDKIALISNSDSHSLERIGREANIFDTELSYSGITSALRKNDSKSFLATIEYYPEEGKYHYDGHRRCEVYMHPKETRKNHGICPRCKKPVVVGVMSRVEKLSDRDEPKIVKEKMGEVFLNKTAGRVPYVNLVTLDSIISEAFGVGVKSKRVQAEYSRLLAKLGSELDILTRSSQEELALAAAPMVAEGVFRMRAGKVSITPGYDGEYGVVKIFSQKERDAKAKSQALF